MKIAFINTIDVDFGLWDINGVTLCERLVKMFFYVFDEIYLIVNKESLVTYDHIICKYNLECISLEEVKDKYSAKDYVMFCDCDILFFSIENLLFCLKNKRGFYLEGKSKEKEICFVLFKGSCQKKEKDIFDVKKVKNYDSYIFAVNWYRYSKCLQYMRNGIKIIDVNNTYIGDDVILEKNVVVYPNSFILGDTYIGEGTIIYPNSIIEDSVICKNSIVGPFVNIKKGSKVGPNSYVGAFVEVKNSCLKSNVKAKHHAYLGDVDIDDNCNIGCGVIFANYDGKNKYRSKVEKNVFIGSNVTIVSPVNIGANSLIGAGSTIVLDVEENSLAIARNKQINKIDYYKGNKR